LWPAADPRFAGRSSTSAPETTSYLASVLPERRLAMEGLLGDSSHTSQTVADMVSVITAALAGSTAALAAAAAFSSLIPALCSGAVVGSVSVVPTEQICLLPSRV
jgi:hypothetical protein